MAEPATSTAPRPKLLIVDDDHELCSMLAEYLGPEGFLTEAVGSGPGRTMLEHFFGEAASGEDLLAMVKKYAGNDQVYDGQMARAVEAVAVDKVPIAEGSNSYSMYPAPVRDLRKALFDRLNGSPREAAIAKKCLEAIDRLRDEHGIAADDVRHPDVMSERPWPPEAG